MKTTSLNNFTKKYLSLTALLLSVIVTLSGCFPTGENDPDVSDDFSGMDTFEYSAENLAVSFDIPETPNNAPIRIKLKEKYFDINEMRELFLGNKPIDKLHSGEGDHHLWTTDKSVLSIVGNDISFRDGPTCRSGQDNWVKNPINYQFNINNSKEHFREIYGIGEEIEGFPSQDAIDRALELCSTLGITNLGKPKVYAFDLEVYENYKKTPSLWIDSNATLTEEHEVYVLRFPQVIGGIELADVNGLQINDSTDNARYGKSSVHSHEVVVGLSRTKIFYFNADEVYEAEYEIISGEPIKYGLNYALSELSAYFDRSYFKEGTSFTAANAVYFPVARNEEGYTEYALAWCFYGLIPKENPNFTENYNIFFLTDSGARLENNYF